jgi:rhodanese-related sulfurtransferase
MRRWLIFLPLFALACRPAPKTAPEFEPPPPALPAGFRQITTEEAARFLAGNPATLVIDARTEAERKAHGQIPGAQAFDYLAGQPTLDRLQKIPNKDKPCLIYCAIGGRARLLAAEMARMGFTEVLLLQHGFNGWVAGGKPVAGKTP